MVDLEALRGLRAIEGQSTLGFSLDIYDNDNLTSIAGLRDLRGVLLGSLSVSSSPALVSLSGLEGVTRVEGMNIFGNSLYIRNNAALCLSDADRARLTTLHLQLDLVTCDVFRAWADACKWAAWRARHPALLDTTTAAATAFPWAQLPQRLRAEEDGRLRALKARLADGAGLEHAARAAWVRRLVDVEAVRWATEAEGLRARVHEYTEAVA